MNFLSSHIRSKRLSVRNFNKIYCLDRSRYNRAESFRTKNQKLTDLIGKEKLSYASTYKVPIINLSHVELTEKERRTMSFGLDYSFVDKNKNIKTLLAANLESLADSVNNDVEPEDKENFHEFLRAYTDMFTKNVFSTKDYTYHNLKCLINNKNIAIIPGDKESCVIILKRDDYVEKIQGMVNDGMKEGVYKDATDTTIEDLKKFKNFLYRNFKNYEKYENLIPTSNQPAQLYGLGKTHKIKDIDNIN